MTIEDKQKPWKQEIKKSIKTILLVIIGCSIQMIMLSLILPNIMTGLTYDRIEKDFANDHVVQIVSDICEDQPTEMEKAKCVVGYYEKNYNFVDHEGMRPASEFIEEGGVCRDFAVNVCATLELMNMSCSYVFPPTDNHVFPIIKVANGYCAYDNEKWLCNHFVS